MINLMEFPFTPNAIDKYSDMMMEDEDMAIELGVVTMVVMMASKSPLLHGERYQSDPKTLIALVMTLCFAKKLCNTGTMIF
jgi:hypothetical protein